MSPSLWCKFEFKKTKQKINYRFLKLGSSEGAGQELSRCCFDVLAQIKQSK
jgi:hypothetical protein